MKRLSVLLFLLIFLFSSCARRVSPTDKLSEFISSYGIEGVIYSTELPPDSECFITPELEKIIFGQSGINANYAIFLNTHLDNPAECGAFLIEGNRDELIELAKWRMNILDPRGERAFFVIYGEILFYSTLSDRGRAENLADIVFSRS